MDGKIKILAFAGSARKESFNKKLIKIAVKGAQDAGAEVTLIDLNDFPMPLYHGDLEDEQGLPENAKKIKKLMIQSDGFLISSPEYNSSISGWLKNTIDWASRKETKDEAPLIAFKDKIVTLMSTSTGKLGGLRGLVHVRSILGNIGAIVLPKQVCVPNAGEAFNDQAQLKDEKQQKEIENLGKELVTFISKLK